MAKNTKTVSFRLSKEDAELLEDIAKREGVSKTEIIRRALQKSENALQDAVQNNTENEAPEAIAALIKQLEVKDKQIDRLTDALAEAQKSVQQAHTLQYTEKQQALTSGGSAQAVPTRWQRFRKSIFGD